MVQFKTRKSASEIYWPLGVGNLCENLFPLCPTLEESSSGSESSGFIRRPFRNLLRSRLQPTTTSSTTEKPTIVYELRCFSKLFFILHRYFLEFEISKKSRLLVFFNFQERIKKSKEMTLGWEEGSFPFTRSQPLYNGQ